MSNYIKIVESLELIELFSGDFEEEVYMRFFATCPEAGVLLADNDTAKKKMLHETIILVGECSRRESYVAGVIEREVVDHLVHGVKLPMYQDYFDAIFEAIRAVCGDKWNQEYQNAWRKTIDELLNILHSTSSGNSPIFGAV